MEKTYFITLVNGSSVRVELNCNALGSFVAKTGVELHDLGSYTKDLSPLRTLIWCAIKEGESLEDRNFPLTESELGRELRAPQIQSFFSIISAQVGTFELKKKPFQERMVVMHPIWKQLLLMWLS